MRPWFQFSIASMLWLTLVVALVISMTSFAIRERRQQAELRSELAKQKGTYEAKINNLDSQVVRLSLDLGRTSLELQLMKHVQEVRQQAQDAPKAPVAAPGQK